MQRVLSSDPFAPKTANRPGFWARQFAVVSTEKQDRFDVIFGIVLPVICLVVDPIVFQGGFFGEQPILGRFQLFAYLFCGLQLGIFLFWRAMPRHLAPPAGLIGGILLAGALFSFIVGVLMLPLTLLALIFLIGIVGFTPFMTSFVYLRTGIRALKAQQSNAIFKSRFLLAAMTGLLSVALPVLISVQISMHVSAAMNQLLYGDERQARVAISWLKWLPVRSSNRRQIVVAYGQATDPRKRDVLKQYYKELTGDDIDRELYFLND
jgi:hypothetical protein